MQRDVSIRLPRRPLSKMRWYIPRGSTTKVMVEVAIATEAGRQPLFFVGNGCEMNVSTGD